MYYFLCSEKVKYTNTMMTSNVDGMVVMRITMMLRLGSTKPSYCRTRGPAAAGSLVESGISI